MSYILADQRDRDVVTAFAAYWEYLLERRSRFPPAAYALAASEWYFDFSDHRCPHDSWLESVTIGETSMGARHEQWTSTLTIRLLGAYHDGCIEFSYPGVYDYDFRGAHVGATDTPPVNHLVPKTHAPAIRARKHPRNCCNLARTVGREKDLMHIYISPCGG